MSITQLDTPFLDGGIRSTNYFNGRLLSREDMQREQDAERAIHERLGRALGTGIVRGFEVEAKSIGGNSVTDPVVTVHAGLAVNRHGQTVALDRNVDVSLLKPAAPASNGAALTGGFATCLPPDNTVYIVGTGVYLLSVAPASQKQGLAVVSGLNNTSAACNAKEVVEGVQFRLFQVKLSAAELADDAHLRNVVAYKFLTADSAGVFAVRDPFGVPAPAMALTDPPLTDCDIPLALFQWTATGGLRWVDLWSVRREERRWAAGRALQLQFQAQLDALRTTASFTLRATQAFKWLPPVGIVPLGLLPGDSAFSQLQFFAGLKTRGPLFIEGARVTSFLHWALTFPPIDLSKPELLWLYWVRENQQPQSGLPLPASYLIFARGQLEYQGEPRFNVSHWNYANFSLGGIRTGT